jgi:hypothetical protein
MCCFSRPVKVVANTRIFARLTNKSTQHLVYQMKYESQEPNAMILPLPVSLPARENSLRFIPLDNYPKFFSDLDRGFPVLEEPLSKKMALSRAQPPTDSKLVVHEVGDFIASFVPTVDDFSRLDHQFVIAKETWSKIPTYSDYGFAVFQLKSLAAEPHPMAFEFESRFPKTIFFPTVHIHDGEVHEREEFDHLLYLQDPAFDSAVGAYQGPREVQRSTGFVRSQSKANQFCKIQQTKGIVESELLVHRLAKTGILPNVDFVKDVSAQAIRTWPPVASRAKWPNYLGLPSVACVTGIGWIIRRRMQLAKRNQQEA